VEKLIKFIEDKFNLKIKPDKIYKRIFFTEAKKRYCGLLPDGSIDVVGLEAVRGDWAELAKEVQEKIIEIILKEGDPQKAVRYVNKVIKELKEGKIPLSKLVIWKTITKRIEDYEVAAAHVTAAKKLLARGIKFRVGDKIGFVIVKGPSTRISDRAEPYFFVKDIKEIDVDYYIERQIVPAALRILGYFGIKKHHLLSTKQQVSLIDFFG
ncbi:MAG TPA: DNA polymerase II, partial [Thermoproteales archaeon]|nr:DNA polymerase II [Thermoproteales archaeon]